MGEEVRDFDERRRRRALNEAAFREINERMAGLNATFAEFTDRFSIVCECDDVACLDQLSVRPDEYEAIRSSPTLFAVVPGHDSPMVETIVEKRDEYHVVEKKAGDPARIAVATDLRTN